MLYGVHVAPSARTLDIREVGRLAEAAGFESLFLPEHTHMPAYGASVHPSGEPMRERLAGFLDPFTALAAVAAVTERLRLGTGVCLITQHDPITLAKTCSTLDLLSGGRLILGVGAGWNREEMANHGSEPRRRWALMRERVLALKQIWTEEPAEFHGDLVDFGPILQGPKPVQRPHPPVLIGGEGPRVLDYGDGWGPNAEPGIPERIGELQRLAHERGKEPIPVTTFHVPPALEQIRRYAEAGTDRCVFTLPEAGRDEVEAALDRLSRLVAHAQAG